MSTATFDTLRFMDRLTEAGIPEGQARAEAEALQEVLQTTDIATKADINLLRAELMGELQGTRSGLQGELKLIRWMLALVVAAEVVPLLAKLFS